MGGERRPAWLTELAAVDEAVYEAVAGTSTPTLDRHLSRLSRAADHSKLSITAAGLLVAGGGRGRAAAISGLCSVAATSAFVNLALKPLARRRRPDRGSQPVPPAREVTMPGSRSFPSGHAAAAEAFATGVGNVLPEAGIPLHFLAGAVGYSRVHIGVHYPGDVIVGALIGSTIAELAAAVSRSAGRRRYRSS